jgi:hypothetical protein
MVMKVSALCLGFAAMIGLAGVSVGADEAGQYMPGGPLAGLKLPLFPTQRGEPAGYPGCIPELAAKGKAVKDMGNTYTEFGPQGQAPEMDLYAGSVERWRNYFFKYLPVRALYDRQSQVKNWVAPAIPTAAKAATESYAAPIYWVPRHDTPVNTGVKAEPVAVYRCKAGAPVFDLDLGTLDLGLYVLRVIGAVPTEQLRSFREPLYLDARVNDGLAGETSFYRVRLGYVDEFYGIGEVFFHAVEKRAYRASLSVGAGSNVDLLMHNISLDDVLAGHVRGAIKTQTNLPQKETPRPGKALPMTPEDRMARDAAIWENFPPVNAQGAMLGTGGDEHSFRPNVSQGTADKTLVELNTEFGPWTRPGNFTSPQTKGVLLVNKRLNLQYTMEDLAAHRPLPDPYPVKDDGAGLYFPDPKEKGKGRVFAPIADEVYGRVREYYNLVTSSVDRWQQSGDPNAARDAGMALARYAYAFPTIDSANFLLSVVRDPGPYGREYRCRRRESVAFYLPHYPMYVNPIMFKYDALFEQIKSDQGLADSVGRYVPWVKSPQDVIALIDTYFVQTVAKRIMRYNYYTDPMDIGNLAAVAGKGPVTAPWIDWLFSRTFVYPLPVAGIQDLMVTGCERDGCEYIGSTYYAQGEGAERVAESVRMLKDQGLLPPQYDVTNSAVFPKPVAQCYWRIANVVAGGDFLRIGDVCGPDKAPGHTLRDFNFARHGWEWAGDSRFAYIIKHYLKREKESDAQWKAIEDAAATVTRAPWMDNRSRVMPMWAGVLETGTQHDDRRLRAAAYVRLGFGVGHQHSDSLDLQVHTHGLPSTIDGGQRGGYSRPGDSTSRVHNVVEVDGKGNFVYSWARGIADAPGARWLSTDSVGSNAAKIFRRQTALIDAREGAGAQPVSPAQQVPGPALPAGVTPADAYVFDVFRVGGGKTHTYCFHGPVDDEFTWNAANSALPAEGSDAAAYLAGFDLPDKKLSGVAPDTLVATWRQHRDGRFGSEATLYGASFRPDLPRHYTRLHLPGLQGAQALKANLNCFQWKYDFSCLMVRKTGEAESMDGAYPAVVEPYRGEPFVASVRALSIPANDADAEKAVAVEVKLVDGRTDLCFADGHPEKAREVRFAPGAVRVAGEAAFYSTDAKGPRQATLAGGTRLEGPGGLRLIVAQRERTGKVVKVDYFGRTLWLDRAWPATAAQPFEVGVPGRMTTYTARKVEADGPGAKLALDGGADFYRAQVEAVDAAQGVVTCALGITMTLRPGIDKQWVASNDDQTQFWRAEYLDNRQFKLTGAPVKQDSFGKANALRLWEYGVGDTARQSSFASVRRIDVPDAATQWELTADMAVEVTLPGGRTVKVTEAELVKNAGTVRIGKP